MLANTCLCICVWSWKAFEHVRDKPAEQPGAKLAKQGRSLLGALDQWQYPGFVMKSIASWLEMLEVITSRLGWRPSLLG